LNEETVLAAEENTRTSNIEHCLPSVARRAKEGAPKILVIDDDPMILNMNGNTLIEYFGGADVYKVPTPLKGLELITRYEFDYIFCDIHFDNSEMDGYEFTRQVREKNKTIKFYLVSSTPRIVAEERARECGADGYIEQPMTEEKIEEVAGGWGLGTSEEKTRKTKNEKQKTDVFIAKLFHDLNRPYVETYNFFRDYESLSRNRVLFDLKKDKILKASEVTRDARNMLLNYLEKTGFSFENREVEERITKKLGELEDLKKSSEVLEEEREYETKYRH
jgi:CheY-like chemotaxis protein